jgi:hypothetical protein
MNPDSVKSCMRCNADLERGYSSRYVGNECTEVICFKCDRAEEMDDFMKTGVITTHFMMGCMMDVYRLVYDGDVHDETKLMALILDQNLSDEMKAKVKVQISTARICNKVKEFESKVWFKGLQDQILATKCRGVSAKLGKEHKNFYVLTWTSAGRTMITIGDDDADVTCVAIEDSEESSAGFHGIHATEEQALALYDKAIALYQDGTLKFKDDKKVSMI